jgi:DNA-binding GntR family transcriptional regulator
MLKDQIGPVRAKTLNEEIFASICTALLDGRLLPGQSVSVRDLAAAVDTSPMPVREALRRLEAQNVLQIQPGRVLRIPGLTLAEVEEIYTIRLRLETLASEACAANATEADVREIETAYEAMDKIYLAGEFSDFIPANYAFHMAIYRAAHMPRLHGMIVPLWLRITPHLWSLVEDRHLKFSMDIHRSALEALFARDAAGLAAAIAADIERAKDKLKRLLETTAGPG